MPCRGEERITADDQPADWQPGEAGKGRIDLGFRARLDHMQPYVSRGSDCVRQRPGIGAGRIEEEPDIACGRNRFVQHFQQFRPHLDIEMRNPGHIATGAAEALRGATVLEALFGQSLAERRRMRGKALGRAGGQETDCRKVRRLQAAGDRAQRAGADQRQDVAALHSITSSARSRKAIGIARPIAFAVLRLITNSNFVGSSTGRSAGLAPFRILPTVAAVWR